jgi:protein-L-isoaspartate(D-aspartate) O-methyltransferase
MRLPPPPSIVPSTVILAPERERSLCGLRTAAARWSRAPASSGAPVPPELDRAIAADRKLAEAGRGARQGLLSAVLHRLAGLLPVEAVAHYAEALLVVPRERFVLPEEIAASADDAPSPLDREGLATVSAPHAYLLSYGLLGLSEGDHLLELGSGTGYGAALASYIVGPRGRVTSIEIDPDLHARAVRLLAQPDSHGPASVELLLGDARALAPARAARGEVTRPLRVTVTYAIAEPPEALLACLPEGGRLVAPVNMGGEGEGEQHLARWTREGGALRRTTHGAVRYVAERG